MTINEKIKNEEGVAIHLYKEGIFWIAYEKSAYALVQHKALKVSKRHVKKINSYIVRVGFPTDLLDYFYSLLGAPIIKDEFYIRINLENEILESDFTPWKEEQVLLDIGENAISKTLGNKHTNKSDNSLANKLVGMIQNYPLATKTPMEAMLFVQSLKRLITQ